MTSVPATCPYRRESRCLTVKNDHQCRRTNPQKHCSARLHSKPSKLVMRVRFPSSALAAESHSPGSERPPHQADGPVAGQITLNPAPVGCTCIRGVDSANLGGDE